MPDEELIQWVRNQRARGFNDEQIREILLNQQIPPVKVENVIASTATLGGIIREKGALFTVLFSILLISYVLPLLGVVTFGLLRLSIIVLIPLIVSLIWLGAVISELYQKNLYSCTLNFLSQPLMALAGLPLIQQFINLPFSPETGYIIMAASSSLFGVVGCFMFLKICRDQGSFLRAGLILSAVTSFVFAVNTLLYTILQRLAEQIALLGPSLNSMASIIPLLPSNSASNPYTSFFIFMVFFNLPFILKSFSYPDKRPARYLLYLIPIAIFFLVAYLLGQFVGLLLPGGMA